MIPRKLLTGMQETILLAVIDKLKTVHGFEISSRLKEYTSEEVYFRYGSLYPTLRYLRENDFIIMQETKGNDGKSQKSYSLNTKGKVELKRRKKEFDGFVKLIKDLFNVSSVDFLERSEKSYKVKKESKEHFSKKKSK